jgi:hypothetical protein
MLASIGIGYATAGLCGFLGKAAGRGKERQTGASLRLIGGRMSMPMTNYLSLIANVYRIAL